MIKAVQHEKSKNRKTRKHMHVPPKWVQLTVSPLVKGMWLSSLACTSLPRWMCRSSTSVGENLVNNGSSPENMCNNTAQNMITDSSKSLILLNATDLKSRAYVCFYLFIFLNRSYSQLGNKLVQLWRCCRCFVIIVSGLHLTTKPFTS